jgi:hypothetical protein
VYRVDCTRQRVVEGNTSSVTVGGLMIDVKGMTNLG